MILVIPQPGAVPAAGGPGPGVPHGRVAADWRDPDGDVIPRSVRDKDLSQPNGRRFLAQGSGYGLRVWSPGAVSTIRTIKTYGIPVVHSTVNVANGREQPTLPELADLLTDDKPLACAGD